MARKLWIVVISLCFVGALVMAGYAQQTTVTADNTHGQGTGEGAQLRQEIQSLRQQAEPLRTQLQQLEAQAKPIREQLHSIREKIKEDREKLESLRGERRENWQEHHAQQQQGQASTPAKQ
jgi:peptidoglycan hydrolase CwlO-like protein